MQELITSFLETLSVHPMAVYTVIGIVSFAEAFAFIGYLVPGAVFMFTAGFLAFQGVFSINGAIFGAVVGGVLADIASFHLARTGGPAILDTRFMRRFAGSYAKGERFFRRHGGTSVMIGRFIGFTRPIVPFLAGMLGMGTVRFYVYNLISGVIWGYAYLGTGYVFGASWKLVQAWTGRFGLVLLGVVVFGVVLRWLVKRLGAVVAAGLGRIAGIIEIRAGQVLDSPKAAAFIDRHPRLFGFISARFDPKEATGLVLSIGIVIGGTAAVALGWVLAGPVFAGAATRIDERVLAATNLLHTRFTDEVFITITHLGSIPAVIVWTLAAVCILVVYGRRTEAFLFGVSMAAGGAMVRLFKLIVDRPRPDSLFTYPLPESSSFPSAHAFISALFAGMVIAFAVRTIRHASVRLWVSVSVLAVAALIGVSRMYLGVHWFTDVLGGWLFAIICLAGILSAHEIILHHGVTVSPPFSRITTRRIVAGAIAGVAAVGIVFMSVSRAVEQAGRYRIAAPKPVKTTRSVRSLPGTLIPRSTTTFTGLPAVPLTGICRGSVSACGELVKRAGFVRAAPVSIAALPEMLLPGASPRPHAVVFAWRGAPPAETFVRRESADPFPRMVLRLWDAGVSVDGAAVSVFTVDREPSRRRRVGGISLAIPEMDGDLASTRSRFRDLVAETGADVSSFDADGPLTGRTIMGDTWQSDGVMLDIDPDEQGDR